MAARATKMSAINEAGIRMISTTDQGEVLRLMEDVTRLDDRVRKLQAHFSQATTDIDNILISTRKVASRGAKIEALDFGEVRFVPAGDPPHRGVTFATVHGNQSIMEAAAAAKGDVKILAVTVLLLFLRNIAGTVVVSAQDPVEDRIAHIQVRGGHVDFRAQHMGPVLEISGSHVGEQIQILLNRPMAIRAFTTRFGKGAAVLSDLLGTEAVDVGLVFPDQLHGIIIELLEVIRGRVLPIAPVESQPA